MKITERTRIFKKVLNNNQPVYSTSISNKKEDGTYENMYVAVNFKKGTEVENNTEIDIKNGFLSFYTNKEGAKLLKLVITDFEICGKQEIQQNEYSQITDDELPF